MMFRVRSLAIMIFLVMIIPGVVSGSSISVNGGTSTSTSVSSSVKGSFAANNNVATFEASSNGFVDEFKRSELLDFGGKGTIDSEAAIKDGSIGIYSEITKPTKRGTETSADLVAGGSSVDVALSGLKDSSSTGQRASVGNGVISSSLNLAIDDSVSAYQNTALTGDEGTLGSVAKSKANDMAVNGGFSGSGDLNTELTSVAGDSAVIQGTTSFNGVEVVNNKVLHTVADGKLSVSADGIYEDRKGDPGNFGVTATNIGKTSQSSSSDNTYKTGGWAWAAPIHYKLSTNLIGSSTSANANLWAQQISTGANEWDKNTAANVFRGSDTAYTPGVANVLEFTTKNPSVGTYQGGTGDGNNNYMAVSKAVTGSTIAVTYNWYYTNKYVNGFNKAAESDVYFNGNIAWRSASAESRTTTNPKFDVRTIATHEVGHSLGLLDLYGSADTDKIMYGYNNGQVKWYLTNADKSGLWALYGK